MRYSNKDFPPYHFIPGKAPHPEKDGGYLSGVKIAADDFNENNFDSNQTYLYAIDLFNHEYFWEAHVYWEVLWNHVGRKTSQGYFLQALIKLAAAGVKDHLEQVEAAQGHIQRAKEHLELVKEKTLFGISKASLVENINQFGHKFRLDLVI